MNFDETVFFCPQISDFLKETSLSTEALEEIRTWAQEVANELGQMTFSELKLHKEVSLVPEIVGESEYGFGDANSPLEIEILLRVPKEAIDKRSFVNCVFLEKRKRVLEKIKDAKFTTAVFENWSDRYPVLVISPVSTKLNAKIIVDVVLSDDFVKVSRFSPEISNLRLSWFRDNDCPEEIKHLIPKNEETSQEIPSPFTNGLHARGLVRQNCHDLCCKLLAQENVNIREAYRLICLWLKRRGFLARTEGFSKMMVALLLASLEQNKRIHRDMSSYQIVRNFWTYMSKWISHLSKHPKLITKVDESFKCT